MVIFTKKTHHINLISTTVIYTYLCTFKHGGSPSDDSQKSLKQTWTHKSGLDPRVCGFQYMVNDYNYNKQTRCHLYLLDLVQYKPGPQYDGPTFCDRTTDMHRPLSHNEVDCRKNTVRSDLLYMLVQYRLQSATDVMLATGQYFFLPDQSPATWKHSIDHFWMFTIFK